MLAQTQILKRDTNKLREEYEARERKRAKLSHQDQQFKTLRNIGVMALETNFPSISKRLRTLHNISRHKRTHPQKFGGVYSFTTRLRYFTFQTYIVLELCLDHL